MLFSWKIPFHAYACCEVDSEILGTPFATICHYSRLFAIICTIRDRSHYSHYSLFPIRDYSLFAIRYSVFPDTHVFLLWKDSVAFPSHLAASTHLTWDVYPVHRKVYTLLEPGFVCHLDQTKALTKVKFITGSWSIFAPLGLCHCCGTLVQVWSAGISMIPSCHQFFRKYNKAKTWLQWPPTLQLSMSFVLW